MTNRFRCALVAVLFFPGAAMADQAVDQHVLDACAATGDLFVQRVQAGDRANAELLKPQVEKCLKIEKAEARRRIEKTASKMDLILRDKR